MTEQAARPSLKDPLLWGIVAVGVALRLIGLRWGLPDAHQFFSFHPDEVTVISPAVDIIEKGDWNPHFFNYGPLYIYLIAFTGSVLQGLRLLDPNAAWSQLHLTGRVITVAMGAATIPVVYLLGAWLGGRRLALASAGVLALLPVHVVHSHFATVDVAATFFVALALWAMVELIDGGRLGWYLLAGAAIGLAAATKWSLAAALAPLFAAHLVARGVHGPPPPLRRLLAALAAAAVVFLAICPAIFSTQDGFGFSQEFVNDISFEMEHARKGGTLAFADTGPAWRYHLTRGLPAGLGYALAAAAVVGFWVVMVRGGAAGIVMVVWALVCLVQLSSSQERFIRYTLPLMPVAAVFAASCCAWSRRPRPRSHAIALTALGAAVIGLTGWYAVQNLATFVRPDPRDRAARWLRPRLERGVTVGLAELPWYFTPPFTPYNGGVRSQAGFEVWRDKAEFRVAVTGWDADRLRAARPDYYVLSDTESADRVRLRQPGAERLTRALRDRYAHRTTFEPAPVAAFLAPPKSRCPPDWLYTRPQITIHRAPGR